MLILFCYSLLLIVCARANIMNSGQSKQLFELFFLTLLSPKCTILLWNMLMLFSYELLLMNSPECTIVFWNMLMLFDYGMTHELM